MAEVVTGKLSEVRDAEVIIERPDGSRITVVVNIRPHKNQRGEVIGAINCFYDITQRKLNEEALRLSDSNKTEFLAMLAHELRNPLAPILVSIEILRRAQQLDEIPAEHTDGPDRASLAAHADGHHRVDHALKVLTRQVAHMERLVDDLLDAARISRGKIELRRERVDLSSVVLNAVDAARPLCEHLQHELTVTVPSDPVFLNADPARLAQIVGNLLNNACKFTPRGGHIWFTVDRVESPAERPAETPIGVGPEVAIRVRDTGIGIAADQMGRVFNLFAQVDTSLERSVTGLGIGLSLVKTLTEMHGGIVDVSSPGVGLGSEFIVRLPIAAETDRPTAHATTTEPAAILPLRILIVDDNRDSADMLATLLTFSGHDTYTANDGLAAVDAAANLQPDVIFMALTNDNRTLGEMFAELSREIRTLVHQEIQLARTELTEKVSRLGKGVGFVIGGGLLAYGGLLAVVAAIVLALTAMGLPAWAAALAGGILVAGVGYLLIRSGLAALRPDQLTPQQTIDTLKEDAQWLRTQTK